MASLLVRNFPPLHGSADADVIVGADAEIFAFGYERCRGEIVSALAALLRTAIAEARDPVAVAAVRPFRGRPVVPLVKAGSALPCRAGGPGRHGMWLGADLRYTAPVGRTVRSATRPMRIGDADRDRPATSLSSIRTVATIAAAGGRAALWANSSCHEYGPTSFGMPTD